MTSVRNVKENEKIGEEIIKKDGHEIKNSKPSKELLEALEEGKKIIQEVREGKRQGYSNVNEMMTAILAE